MGTGKGRKPTADPAEQLGQQSYEPPPKHACNVVELHLDLIEDPDQGQRHLLYVQAHHYRDKVVWFCLEQTVRAGTKVDKVVRVDTAHGTVHIHRFTQSNQEGTKETLHVIPNQGHDVVDAQYNEWLDRLLDDWEDSLRRWRGC